MKARAASGPAEAATAPKARHWRGRLRTPLTQNPHAVRDPREKVLEVAIGREVRAFRKKLGITVADLAVATDISIGMLSKIENGITSPSLTTLQALSRALGVPVTAFFRRFEEERRAVFVKAGEGLDVERRGTRAGHQYNLLGHIGSNTSGVVVEPYLITLTEDSDVFPTFQHEGMEFLYMLEGEVVYRHGEQPLPHEARRQPVLRRRRAARPGELTVCRCAISRSSAIRKAARAEIERIVLTQNDLAMDDSESMLRTFSAEAKAIGEDEVIL